MSPKTVGKCQCRGTMTLGCSTRELNSMPETTLRCRGTQFWNGNFDMGPYHNNCVRTVKMFTCAGGSFQDWSRHWFLHCNTVWDVALTKALCEFGNKNANKQVFERNSIIFCNHLLHWTCICVEYETCWMHKTIHRYKRHMVVLAHHHGYLVRLLWAHQFTSGTLLTSWTI